ncbi:hypothetical protein VUR80DRAFT_2038 [Thermomyces stellatus]
MITSSKLPRPHTPQSEDPAPSTGITRIIFWTPKSSHDARKQLKVMPVSSRRDPSMRQLFTKMSKGLDARNFVLATQDANIEELKAEISGPGLGSVKKSPLTLIVSSSASTRSTAHLCAWRKRSIRKLHPGRLRMLVGGIGVAPSSYSSKNWLIR